MRLLLFLLSLIFSFIFYSFYLLSVWKSFFWNDINYKYFFDSIFWNLLIESITFLFFWIIFLFSFTSYKSNNWKNNTKIILILYYLFLLIPIYFNFFEFNFTIFSILSFFIFWDIAFKFLSNLDLFKEQKLNLRYFWLVLNYIAFISSFIYLFIIDFSYYIFLIISYSILFNYQIHKNYTNYISLLLSILGSIFFVYFLFLKIQELYILLF